MKLAVYCFLFAGSFFVPASAQVVRFDIDSLYIFGKHADLVNAIKKENTGDNIALYLELLEGYKKQHRDTLKLDSGESLDFEREIEHLLKKGQVSFFDRRSNKPVKKVARKRDGKVGHVTYFTYYDAETKSELYHVLIKTWQKF